MPAQPNLVKQRHDIPSEIVEEILNASPSGPSVTTENWISHLISSEVDERPGYLVIGGLPSDDPALLRNACLWLSGCAGTVVPQDAKGTMLREVADRGTKIGEGVSARYADSRHGGNIHTDGAEAPFPVPDYFALLCVRQASHGGYLRLLHVEDVVESLSAHPTALAELRKPFHFDRRGDQRVGEQPTVCKPVLFEEDGVTCVTYLREYIEVGHRHPGVPPLSAAQSTALDLLDDYLDNPPISSEGRLEPGDFALIDNRRILHGRTTFEDGSGPNDKRLLYRTWIQRSAV